MITRFYADNYKCLVNFEYHPKSFELILGRNGAGKTTCVRALHKIVEVVSQGKSLDQVFKPSSLTRWDSRQIQSFEIDVVIDNAKMCYHLRVEHDSKKKTSRVLVESLREQDHLLFLFENGDVNLFRDDFSAGPKFPSDWTRSALFSVPERNDNIKLTSFRQFLANIISVRVNPMSMESFSFGEASAPDYNLENFASWYRHLAQEQPEQVFDLTEDLREVIDGFSVLQLIGFGKDRRELSVKMKADSVESKNSALEFEFDELSDGQRALVALYTLANCSVRAGSMLIVDEPENFVALRELQPWLITLQERLEDLGGQIILISHHPEFINMMSPQNSIQFARDNNGPVRIRPFDLSQYAGLMPSEIIARGWEDE